MLEVGRTRIRAISLITIRRPPSAIYAFCRDFMNLPQFMSRIQSVHVHDAHRSTWVERATRSRQTAWDVEVVYDRDPEHFAWHARSTSGLDSTGSLSFRAAPYSLGTDVLLELRYSPTATLCPSAFARRCPRKPCQQVSDALHLLKRMLESDGAASQTTPPPTHRTQTLIGASA